DCCSCSTVSLLYTAASTTEFSTLSLHDALPISSGRLVVVGVVGEPVHPAAAEPAFELPDVARIEVRPLEDQNDVGGLVFKGSHLDRKSTRLNSSHVKISYAVFCLKKKKNHIRS